MSGDAFFLSTLRIEYPERYRSFLSLEILGATVMPPLFGVIADTAGIGWYPVWLLLILGLMGWMLERKNKICNIRKDV